MKLGASRDPAAMAAALARAAGEGEERFVTALEQVPVAAYRTDRNGTVTHFNRACIPFAGRVPIAHHDRWCVTWRLYTEDDAFLPHHQCPMAVALREGREVRGVRAVAERPDGGRVPFAPYPTPLHNEHGDLVGAINLLVDLSPDAAILRRGGATRQFRAIFAPLDAGGFDTYSFEARDFSEAFAALAAYDCRRPFQLWCDGSFFGRFQRVVEGSASYWRLIGGPIGRA
jgi:hypothetical protein